MKNRKSIILIIVVIFIFCIRTTLGQNLIWAKQMGGTGNEFAGSITSNSTGEVITAGLFLSPSADFDPGSGSYNLSYANGASFISKLNTAGDFVFAGQMADMYSIAWKVLTNASDDIFICGSFDYTSDFDPGPGTYTLTTDSGAGYLVKLNEAGNFEWALSIQRAIFRSMVIDLNNHIYISGPFENTVDFDPGSGVYNMSSSNGNMFLLKLDGNGDFLWAKQFGGNGDLIHFITVDTNNDLVISGTFSVTTDFDPGSGVYTLSPSNLNSKDAFILKLDANANFIWVKQIELYGGNVDGIAADPSGNIILSGQFNLTADFDPGPGVFNMSPIGTWNMFILKLDANGNFIYAKRIGEPSTLQLCRTMMVDPSGNLYFAGEFNGNLDFDPDAGMFYLNAGNSLDPFVLKLNSNGNFQWAIQFESVAGSVARDISMDNNSHLLLTGSFMGNTDFDPGSGVSLLSSFGGSDIFVVKMENLTGINENELETFNFNFWPNPANGQISVYLNDHIKNGAIRIFDISGKEILETAFNEKNHLLIDISEFAKGLYFISCKTDELTTIKKLIIQRN